MAQLIKLFQETLFFREQKNVSIDSWSFQLFNTVTSGLLLLGSIIATARQFFGEPIICDAGAAGDGISDDVLKSYCWMYAHFKIPPEYKGPCSGSEQDDFEGIIYNSYYQWVPIFLVLLAVLFYVPRCLWMSMEGGLMKFFGRGTTSRVIEDPDEKRDKLVEFFRNNIHNKYNVYFYGFIFCEVINMLILVASFFLTHRFLHYRFAWYGFNVYAYYQLPAEEQRLSVITNPMCYTFPRIAACTYHRYGSGGRQENINAICILALNIINDKVFLVLWWWFVFLFLLGIFRLIFRATTVLSYHVRYALLNLRLHRYFKQKENSRKIRKYLKDCSKGDWFVLYQLSKNLNRGFFMDFLINLCNIIEHEKTSCKDNDTGDDFLDLMLSPTLSRYQSKDSE